MIQFIGLALVLSGCQKKPESSTSQIGQGMEESAPLEEKRPEATNPHSSNSAGFVDKNIIDTEIRNHINDISACYENALKKNPSLGGFVMVRFVIAQNGTVSRATTAEDTLESPDLTECILAEFMTMKFPAGLKNDALKTSSPEGRRELTISYPFRFAPE